MIANKKQAMKKATNEKATKTNKQSQHRLINH